MAAVAMSGNDTVIIGTNNPPLAGLADGNVAELTFPNEIANVKTGKNGNSIFGLNETGRQCELKVRVIRGSADDQALQVLLSLQQNNFAGFPLINASLTKVIGDGTGKIISDTYNLSGGVFTKQVEAKSNVEGDTEQSVAIYMMKFSNNSVNSPRSIG